METRKGSDLVAHQTVADVAEKYIKQGVLYNDFITQMQKFGVHMQDSPDNQIVVAKLGSKEHNFGKRIFVGYFSTHSEAVACALGLIANTEDDDLDS